MRESHTGTKQKKNSPRSPARRKFLRTGLIAAGVFVGGSTLTSIFGERTWLTPRRVEVPLTKLPPPLEGFTISHLSDLHRGPYISEEQLREAAQMAMAYAPDLIVLTGDLLSLTAKYAKSCAAALSTLQAPYGVYAVLGNHEYWTDEAPRITSAYREAGVKVLINDSARISIPGFDWWLCGLDDMWEGRPDLEGMLAKIPEYAFKLLLCHEPDFADQAAKYNIPLQLSGHSHGGQIRVPGVGPIRLPVFARKYPYGLQRVSNSNTFVYTTAGVGVTFPPIRLNCRPEVAILRLTRDES